MTCMLNLYDQYIICRGFDTGGICWTTKISFEPLSLLLSSAFSNLLLIALALLLGTHGSIIQSHGIIKYRF